MIRSKIQYLKACYQADFRTVSLLNYNSKRVTKQFLMPSAELLEGKLKWYPLPTEWAEDVTSHLQLHGKEKALFCGAFFLTGNMRLLGRSERVLAPLYLYSAEIIEHNDVFYATIDADDPIINPAISNLDGASETGRYEAFSEALPRGYIGFEEMDKIETTLETFFPDWNLNSLKAYPEIESLSPKTKEKQEQPFRMISAAGLCLLDKPDGSRGIMNELEIIGNQTVFAPPIQQLLNPNFSQTKPGPILKGHNVPASLSEHQQDIIKQIFQHPVQMVVGPPGTGKSFTIAALTAEMMSRGKSVLIVSKNEEAVQVVADKIEHELGLFELVIRANKKDYKKLLQKRLENLLSGIGTERVVAQDVESFRNVHNRLHRKIQSLESEIRSRLEQHLAEATFFQFYKGSLFDRLKLRWLHRKNIKLIPVWSLVLRLEEKIGRHHLLLRKYLKIVFHYHLNNALILHRTEIQKFVRALKSKTGNQKETYFNAIEFEMLLGALPIWAVNLSDVHRVLPLQAELFDLVIVDEATQCDLASVLPVLQRGKRALVVGDPKQLRHLSFLSQRLQQQLAEQYNLSEDDRHLLDYRNQSLLDLVSDKLESQQQVHFLNEHYRSMPDIIAFSNKHFYANRLHIMSSNPHSSQRKHVFQFDVMGRRNARGQNLEEVNTIIDRVQSIIESEASIDSSACQTLGIISPFRDQVDCIRKRLLENIPFDAISRHRIMVGTPFSFQGEERDIIFLSYALDDSSHPSAFQYLNREDVFNVSITRARSRQEVYTSFTDLAPAGNLLKQYIQHCRSDIQKEKQLAYIHYEDKFFNEVFDAIKRMDVDEIFPAYAVAGVEIDLVVTANGKTYGIDLAGFPGDFSGAMQLEACRMLHRSGVPVFYLPFSSWFLFPDSVEAALRRFLAGSAQSNTSLNHEA